MDERAGRLRWRCRRGMKELDALLTRYLNGPLATAETAEWDRFERLLECEDDQLWDWLSGRIRPPDQVLGELVDRIRLAT
jgi:antitoxin CptB